MTEKFRNKYRITTARLKGYDYTRNGAYFVTICTKKMTPYFGQIESGNVNLTETGIIIRDFWLKIPSHFPIVCLDEFIIMPDHLHGIIIIKSQSGSKSNYTDIDVETPKLGVSTPKSFRPVEFETPKLGVSTPKSFRPVEFETPKLGVSTNKTGNPFWKSNSIGSIINQFKRICIVKTKSIGLDLSWQPRFYDHIIHSDNELNRIRNYIKDNPLNWLNDKYQIN